MIGRYDFKKLLNPAPLRVGDKHLAETVLAHQADNLVDPFVIQFIKDIIEQQNRLESLDVAGVFELGQLNGDDKRLLLPLRAEFLQRMTGDHQFQVILMDPLGGKAQRPVAIHRDCQQLIQVLIE